MSNGSVNKVILVGRLGQDPELRWMPNGNAVANFTVATSESWKDQQGQKQERTEWIRIVIYRKLAEIAGEYLRKGSKVYLEGRLQTREWQDQQGQKKYTTEIICHEMQMLDGKPNDNQPQGGKPQGGYQQPRSPQNQSQHGNASQRPNQQNRAPQGQSTQGQQPQGAYQYNPNQYQEPPMDFDDNIPF